MCMVNGAFFISFIKSVDAKKTMKEERFIVKKIVFIEFFEIFIKKCGIKLTIEINNIAKDIINKNMCNLESRFS